MKKSKDVKVKPGDQSMAPKTGKFSRPQGEDACSPSEFEEKAKMAPKTKKMTPSKGDHPSTPPQSHPMKEPDKEKLA